MDKAPIQTLTLRFDMLYKNSSMLLLFISNLFVMLNSLPSCTRQHATATGPVPPYRNWPVWLPRRTRSSSCLFVASFQKREAMWSETLIMLRWQINIKGITSRCLILSGINTSMKCMHGYVRVQTRTVGGSSGAPASPLPRPGSFPIYWYSPMVCRIL